MERVIEKSLRKSIADEITHINAANTDFYALINKLGSFDLQNNPACNQRL